jgi:hypothetical protein
MINNLPLGFGLGTGKVSYGSASVADGDTIDTGLDNIVSVQLTAQADSGSYAVANVESISGGTITVGLTGAASGSAPASISSATTVYYVAIGN